MEHNNKLQTLSKVVSQLNELIDNSFDQNEIFPFDNSTEGFSESMLIGTTDSYLDLAKRLLEVVGAALDEDKNYNWNIPELYEIESTERYDVSVFWTNHIIGSFNEFSPIWLMCAFVCDNKNFAEIQSKTGKKYIFRLNVTNK